MNREKEPIINWQGLASLNRPKMPQDVSPAEMWDKASIMYNKMAKMEKGFTLNQINAIPLRPTDEVMDCGCGPGRITVPVAKRVKSVTSVDCAEKMLEKCKENVAEAGLNNVEFIIKDFNDEDFVEKMKKFDVVICSRSAGLSDLEKLSAMSKGIVAIITWANAPSIPQLLNELFAGCTEEGGRNGMMGQSDRRVGYNVMFNVAYDLGYQPNISVVEDGFEKTFASNDEAYEFLSQLRDMKPEKMDTFKKNADKFLTKNSDGTVTYLQKTESVVIWWSVNKA